MSTALQIIDRALRKVGALSSGESSDSDMSADALADLNAMLSEWLDLGIEISNGEVLLTDVIPNDIADENAVLYNLARRLLIEYPSTSAIGIISEADNSYRNLLAKYVDVDQLQVEIDLLPNRRWYFDING